MNVCLLMLYLSFSLGKQELSLFRYLMAEISRGYLMELEEDKYTEKRRKVYKIMKIPKEFEKVFYYYR